MKSKGNNRCGRRIRMVQGTTVLLTLVSILLPLAVQAADVDIGYKEGLYIKTDDGNYLLKTNIQLQPQYQFLSMEGQGKTNTFQMRRARIIWKGNAFTPELTFKFQLEAVGGRTNTTRDSGAVARGPNLRDAYINYAPWEQFQIQGGQFKPYFNFEELTSSTRLQFVDRSLANQAFSLNRDLGVGLHGKVGDDRFEYGVYATNEGTNRNTVNPNNEFLVGGRGVFVIAGKNKYTQSDVDWSEDPNIAVGVAGNYNRVSATPDQTVINTTADLTVRYRGFSFLGAGFFTRNETLGFNTYGFLGQAGYFVVRDRFEIAGRFDGVIPTAAGATNGYEAGGSLNVFFYGHRLKIQTDYNVLINSPLVLNGAAGPGLVSAGQLPGFTSGQTDHQVRLQTQLLF